MVRSRQTSRTRSISASWCHTFGHPTVLHPGPSPFGSQMGLLSPPVVTQDAQQPAANSDPER